MATLDKCLLRTILGVITVGGGLLIVSIIVVLAITLFSG